jgi:hypothetical protein
LKTFSKPLPARTLLFTQFDSRDRFPPWIRHPMLRRLTEQTGGRAFFPVTAADVRRAYKAIRSELAHQYVLAYISTDRIRSAGFHQLAVIIERPGAVARTRRGYFTPGR